MLRNLSNLLIVRAATFLSNPYVYDALLNCAFPAQLTPAVSLIVDLASTLTS